MGSYRTILADPPWSYSNRGVEGSASREYQTMPLEDICSLPVREASASDAVLLLWATWPLLPEAFAVMEEWGFAYKAGFPWIKIVGGPQQNIFGELDMRVPYGTGWWVRGCSEPLLIGVRGEASPPSAGFVGLLSPNFRHSRKPESIHEYAESLPGPHLELFARQQRPGWTCLGNALDGLDIRESLAAAAERTAA